MTKQEQYTPRQLTEYLDKYIIGQEEAKRAIAVAVRNRYRRMRLPEEVREEVIPKNILMIGPTGVGKTEIARRMAKFIEAPFIKVEATKFTEVGYVGRDVESIIRDLVEVSIRLVKEKMREDVKEEAVRNAEKRLIELLVPKKKQKKQQGMTNPFEMLFGQQQEEQQDPQEETERKRKRSEIGAMLRIGKLEDELVELDVAMPQSNVLGMMPGANAEQLGQLQDALSSIIPTQTTKRTMKVKDARRVLEEEEADKLLDEGKVARLAIELTEQSGIVFIDEFDKIASRSGSQQSQDVSREGVQRDILPIVEGSQVTTKYGVVRTDFILFIAAGAFHISKPSDIIPELQGRFPIRVELNKLKAEHFERILREPEHSLLRQSEQLLATENVTIRFEDEAITRLAEIAYEVNDSTENIGARRLHTIIEKLLEQLSFEAPDIAPTEVIITRPYVDEKLQKIVKDEDLSRFIL